MTAQFDQAHLLALAQVFDPVADALVLNEGFRHLRIDPTRPIDLNLLL